MVWQFADVARYILYGVLKGGRRDENKIEQDRKLQGIAKGERNKV